MSDPAIKLNKINAESKLLSKNVKLAIIKADTPKEMTGSPKSSNIIKRIFVKKFANQISYVILYFSTDCLFSMTVGYFYATLPTIGKQFLIPPNIFEFLIIGYDLSELLLSGMLSYIAGKQNRPHWIGYGIVTIVFACFLMILPHLIYGTTGTDSVLILSDNLNSTNEIMQENKTKSKEHKSYFAALAPIFLSFFVSGIGCSIYSSLGFSYMDDNVKKSNTPMLLGIIYLLRCLGPIAGRAIAKFCLSINMASHIEPLPDDTETKMLGAWWLGWFIFAALFLMFAGLLSMFPKELTNAKKKRKKKPKKSEKMSLKNMIKTFKSLFVNKIFMFNMWSSFCYNFGTILYSILTPNFIRIQFLKSEKTSYIISGTIRTLFSSIGYFSSGLMLSRLKPSARKIALWNLIIGFVMIFGIFCNAFLGFCDNEKIVKDDSNQSFSSLNQTLEDSVFSGISSFKCGAEFLIYLTILSLITFLSATGSATSFLITMRCVLKTHKTAAIGLETMVMSGLGLLTCTDAIEWAFNKLHLEDESDWLHMPEFMRYLLNSLIVILISIGILFGVGVWGCVKNLKVFDKKTEDGDEDGDDEGDEGGEYEGEVYEDEEYEDEEDEGDYHEY